MRISSLNLPFPIRVLIKRGDCLIIRNDIPHHMCENMSDFEHHHLHCNIEPDSLVGESGTGALKATKPFGPVPTFDEDTHLFNNPFDNSLQNYWDAKFRIPAVPSDTEDEPDSKLEANVEEV